MNAMNEKLKTEQRMMGMIINTSSSAFVYYSYAQDEVKMLGKWDDFFGFQIKRVTDLQRIIDMVDEKYRDDIEKCIYIDRQGENKAIATVLFSDSRKWIEVETDVVYDIGKTPTDKVIRFKDVTVINTRNEELKYMAYYDNVTGLYNRNYFIRCLSGLMEKANEEQRELAVMFVDIDDFRRINDGMGLVVGDELMMEFGQFLGELSSENVIVSHFNGDLYCIGIYNPVGANSVENIYMNIRQRTRKPFAISDGREIFIKITAGVAMYPDASGDVFELINCAEIVMLRAKHNGKDNIQYFDSAILSEFLNNVKIENKLRQAVFDMNFQMYYQPQYSAVDNTLRGVEALIRWKDSDEGMISPAVFIPLAEKNGTIISIGKWVVEESVRTYTRWKQDFNKNFVLSLNISAMQYKKDDFVEQIIQVLEKYNMNPADLELEITETALIDNYRDITGKLELLREYGIKISMDDFGTGYSSLSYLKSLPIDTLKIDKTFIDTVLEDSNTEIIMESIMNMGKRLGLETVAEGVETKEQLEYLQRINCDNIQGFLLGRPQTEEDIRLLLSKE